MRLNWNNVGKGLEAIAGAKQARDLAQESARYDVTAGAYGPGLQENIQQLEGLRANVADPAQNSYDPQQLAAYDQAIAELTRRQGLTAADYSVASGPTNYATRQEARQAAAPMRAEGLAGVYRRYGDVAKADELETRAYEQQRALAKEARDVEAFGLTKTKAQQDIDTGALTLEQRRREADDAKKMDTFNKAFGEANAKAQAEGRALTPNDIAKLAKDAKLSYSQENELIASQVNRTKAEVDQFRLEVEKTVQGKGFESLVDLHKNDKRFGDGVHFVPEIDPKTGGVTMARVNEATGKVEERLKFKTKAEATAYLREEAANPANAAIWLQNYKKGAAAIDESEASTGLKKAQAAYFAGGGAAGGKDADAKIKAMEKSLGRKLTEEEKLIQFGIQPKPSNRPDFTPQAYSATIKNYVDLGMSIPEATAKADELYGRGPATTNIDAGLQKANAAKGVGTAKAPIEVRAGESRMTEPGAAVRGPLRDFVRESRRGLFGGVEYFYTDPVTNKRYTAEQYNQMQTQ